MWCVDVTLVTTKWLIAADVRSLKWKLWHGQTDRALDQLETMTNDFAKLRERVNLSATRLLHLAHPLLTYVRSNKTAIINYGARYRSGRRIATALAESGVNSLVARRMVKRQQMQWSKRGAHLLLQVRAAVFNGDLRERLTYKPPKQANRSRIAWMFEPTPPLLKRPNTPANLTVPIRSVPLETRSGIVSLLAQDSWRRCAPFAKAAVRRGTRQRRSSDRACIQPALP
jgi:hypothetical protein